MNTCTTNIEFQLVAKVHAIVAAIFAVIFLFASFDWSLPILGPAALLQDWDTDNASLVYMTRLTCGFLMAIGLYEWNFSNSKRPFVTYHAILSILMLYSSLTAAVGILGWLYAILILLFLIAGILGTTDDIIMESVDESSKTPVVLQTHAIVAGLFGLVFLLASFGFDIPLFGPAALLHGWHMNDDNAALVYLVRFVSGLLIGICFYEWMYSKAVKVQPSFNLYHAVTAVLTLYSSVDAAKGAAGWLYAILITAFLVAGLVAERM